MCIYMYIYIYASVVRLKLTSHQGPIRVLLPEPNNTFDSWLETAGCRMRGESCGALLWALAVAMLVISESARRTVNDIFVGMSDKRGLNNIFGL